MRLNYKTEFNITIMAMVLRVAWAIIP